MSQAELDRRRAAQGDFTFAAQMLLDPLADRAMGFRREWLQHWPASSWAGMNVYILVDPASGKKKQSGDYTSMWVVALGRDGNFYALDHVRDRLNLAQRGNLLFDLVQTYRPRNVGYEEYGLQADIEYVKIEQERRQYRFQVTALGGRLAKPDRIQRLIPVFSGQRIYLPASLTRYDTEGRAYDPIRMFVEEEFVQWPFSAHDDSLDALSRILDPEMGLIEPVNALESAKPSLPVHLLRKARADARPRSWMAG